MEVQGNPQTGEGSKKQQSCKEAAEAGRAQREALTDAMCTLEGTSGLGVGRRIEVWEAIVAAVADR